MKKKVTLKMKDTTYDKTKWVAMILLPALAVLYLALAALWGLPYAQEIAGTISAVDVFLGALLGISTSAYNKGLEDSARK